MLFTFLNMTHGSCTGSLSESGQGGIRILDLSLASALESASSAGLAGAGDTGDTTGVVMEFSSTTAATFRTAESSSIATTSIAPADFMEPTDFMAGEREDSRVASMDLRRRTASLVRIPGHSVVLIMEESREASHLVGSRALAEASTEVEVSTEAEGATEAAVTGKSVQLLQINE